jgi:hypothetical protein
VNGVARAVPRAGVGRDEVSLVDALDRLLERGVAVQGDLVLSVAEVDLVWLGLRAVLGDARHAPAGAFAERASGGAGAEPPGVPATRATARPSPRPGSPVIGSSAARPAVPPGRVQVEGDRVERGLVKLVLSVVELLRQLMERQALRRVDDQSLDTGQIERLGCALMRLEERMADLTAYFGLEKEDLDLRLGLAADSA